MVTLKVREDDENSKNIIRKLQGINITAALLADENFAKDCEGHEDWLLERDKVPSYFYF